MYVSAPKRYDFRIFPPSSFLLWECGKASSKSVCVCVLANLQRDKKKRNTDHNNIRTEKLLALEVSVSCLPPCFSFPVKDSFNFLLLYHK